MKRGDRSRFDRGLVDMTGQVVQGFTVISRAPNASGSAVWFCRHHCGLGVVSVLGTRLRGHVLKYCDRCRPKPPGTVTRVREYAAAVRGRS